MTRGEKRIFLSVLGMVFLCQGHGVFGAGEEKAVLQEQKSVPSVSAGASAASSKSALVSLDFKDADIQVVLQALARKAGVNIIASNEVSGVVTIHLDNVSWEQALDAIVTNYGYGYDHNDNVVLVSTLEELKSRRETMKQLVDIEPIVTKVLELKYLRPAEAKSFLESQLSSQGKISVLESPPTKSPGPETGKEGNRPKAVVMTDTRTTVNRLEKILAKIDVPSEQGANRPVFAGEEETVSKQQFSLQGIVFDPKALSYAIINGKIVGEMEEVGNAKVLKIEPTTVTVLANGQKMRLTVRQPVKENSEEP